MQPLNKAFGPWASGLALAALCLCDTLGTAVALPPSASPPSVVPPSAPSPSAAPEAPPPETPREFFNAGTRDLGAGKLREAEASLEAALASQSQRLQPPALYNLGLVRYAQGAAELKKGPAAKPTAAMGHNAIQRADAAVRQAKDALASNEVERMVAAYQRGRGARKDLKAATEAVLKAMKAHGTTLARWERASGDFKSTVELNSADADARQNAEIMDRRIAKLVDSMRDLQHCSSGMCDKNKELNDALSQLKGRIPAPNMPPGSTGEEDDDDKPSEPQPAQQEGPSKDGKETSLSPEQAGWLLDAYRLDSERRLPMGDQPAPPKERSRPTW